MFKSTKRIYLWVFLFFLVLHAFIFRDILFHIPQLLSGSEVVVREELVPFFDWNTQFFSQISGGYSNLTSTNEVRIAYSFLTSWIRYYQILPFAIILLNALSAFLLFYSFFLIARDVFNKHPLSLIVGPSFFASLLIHLIILYSKVIHFYTLIIGFSLFAVAISLFIHQLFFISRIRWRNVLLISILVLLNPAIHFHILFYITIIFIAGISLIFSKSNIKHDNIIYLKKCLLLITGTVLISLIPYVIFIFATTGDDVGSSIPAFHYLIKNASIDISHLFSLDSASQIDMFLYGEYIPDEIRWSKILLLFPLILFFFTTRKNTKKDNRLILILMLTMFFSFWMSLGYSEPFSFHNLLKNIAIFLSEFPNYFTDLILKILNTFIQILRLPHRFQFLSFYCMGLLSTLLFPLFFILLRQRLLKTGRFLLIFFQSAIIIFFLFPVFTNADYLITFSSGNFNEFIKPWPVNEDLIMIKRVLQSRNDGRLLILPTLESGRVTGTDNTGYNSFIDKFYIYYLNYPTLYYGANSSLYNKLVTQLIYRSILYNEDWWQNILVNLPNVKYVLLNKAISYRTKGKVYIPQLEDTLYYQIENSRILEKIYIGNQYDLYRIKDEAITPNITSVDLGWNNYLQLAIKTSSEFRKTLNLIPFNLIQSDHLPKSIISDNPKKTILDIYALKSETSFFKPFSYLIPFEDRIIPSVLNTYQMVTMFSLYGTNNLFGYYLPGMYQALNGEFIALRPGNFTISIPFTVRKSGENAILLRQFSSNGRYNITIKKGEHTILDHEYTTHDYGKMVYSFSYMPLTKRNMDTGDYLLQVNNTGSTLFIDGLLVVPVEDISNIFNESTTTPVLSYSIKLGTQKYIFSPQEKTEIPMSFSFLNINVLSARKNIP